MRLDQSQDSAPNISQVRRWEFILLALFACVLILFRWHAFSLPLETDECNYAYIGARLLEGQRLYVDLWDHQPPGIFILFAGAIAAFGDQPIVFRILALAFSLGSLVLVWGIGRNLWGRNAGALAALLFAIVSSDPGTAGEGCNREIFMNTFVLGAWWVALRAIRVSYHGSIGRLLLAGVLLGLGSVFKTNVSVYWLGLAVWLIWVFLKAGNGLRRGQLITWLAAFGAGPAVLWGGIFVYFYATGRFSDFFDAVFTFNLGYSEAGGLFNRLEQFVRPPRDPFVFDSAAPLWIGATLSLVWLASGIFQRRDWTALSVLIMGLSGVVGVCLPGKFWPHYYYLLIPSAAVATGVGICGFIDWLLPNQGLEPATKRRSIALASAFTIVSGSLLHSQFRHYLLQPPFGITVKRYNSRDFWGRGHGLNVSSVTSPTDTVFVFGNDASIYYYARRRCASRFTMITGLHGAYPGFEKRRTILLNELKAAMPRLILVVFDQDPWPEWVSFLREHYSEPIGWDFDDKKSIGGQPKAIMLVVARKDRPVPEINWDWDRSSVGGWLIHRHGVREGSNDNAKSDGK